MYGNTEEYRQILRAIVKMDPTKHYSDATIQFSDDLDDETVDELTYDNQAMSHYLDGVYQTTKSNALFQRLYFSAAALMISTNPEIGLAILFSYDYLAPFYLCYQSYLLSPSEFSENNQFYHSLVSRLEKN
jgi:hypothetical protein